MDNKLYEKVVKIISKELDIDEKKFQPKSNFVDDLGCDSLDTVEIVMKIEEEFGIHIPDDCAEKIHTVGELTDFIEGQLK